MERIVDQILEMEWEMFQKTQNIGGRASCQDDRQTFFVMRESQWRTFEEGILKSYLKDLQQAEQEGRNLVTEKYGYMMESYDPEGFAAIKDRLPAPTERKKQLVEAIWNRHLEWYQEALVLIPHIEAGSRSLRSSSDSIGNVSIETYMRGELLTFSEETLQAYLNYVVKCQKEGTNLVLLTYEHMARCYGFESLAEMEQALAAASRKG